MEPLTAGRKPPAWELAKILKYCSLGRPRTLELQVQRDFPLLKTKSLSRKVSLPMPLLKSSQSYD